MAAHLGQAFIVYAESRACKCDTAKADLFKSRSRDMAIKVANGHWCLYVAFYGTLVHWHNIIVVNTRDGVIIWENGRLTKEGRSGPDNETKDWRAGRQYS